jgi:hypothetical protein
MYVSTNFPVEADASLDALVVGLGVNFQGEWERGAEGVMESGQILRYNRMPLVTYPPISSDMIPQQSLIDKETSWIGYASPFITQALNQTVATIANDVNGTVIVISNAVSGASSAVLNISQGAIADGSQVYSWVASGLSSALGSLGSLSKIHPLGGPGGNTATYLPPDDSSNCVYGIDGVYRFASTNAFNGTATLTIAYNPADVTGLNPTNLQIYQLPDGTNRWQLIGSVVNTVSNTVTATITSLGTYAIAPPLPTANLQLILSTNALPADGRSTMTVVVTNLMLNTGNVATQQWLFTATASGVQILNPDCDTNLPGVQLVSTNSAVTLLLQAPPGGTVANPEHYDLL